MQQLYPEQHIDLGKCECLRESHRALLFRLAKPVEGKLDFWVPRSCVLSGGHLFPGKSGRVIVKEYYWRVLAFSEPRTPPVPGEVWVPEKPAPMRQIQESAPKPKALLVTARVKSPSEPVPFVPGPRSTPKKSWRNSWAHRG